MAKSKVKENRISLPNKHLYSRINYLYQAARYLESTTHSKQASGNSCHLVDELQHVALKTQIRLTPGIKHGICRQCQTVLEEGTSLKSYIQNESKDGAKPWADILIRECKRCGAKKRIPIGATRQVRRHKRTKEP